MSEKEPLSTEPYKGVHDYYPEDWARLQAVFETIRRTLRSYGYEEYQASPMERAELYEAKTSEEIVSQQTYTFEDRGGRRVTLRPEMTPTLARMVAGKRRELVFPLRWFSIGNRFRYERPQKGRSREFYQADVDIIGIEGVKAEGEAVVMAHELVSAFGAKDKDFAIRVNSRRLLNTAAAAAGLTAEEAASYLALLDKKEKMPADVFEEARAPYRKNGKDPLELIEERADPAITEELDSLMALVEAFRERGVTNVSFDPTVVRGFLYYTGIVFEVFDTNPENPRALLGGGGYDGLVALFGGEPVPAVGFAIGIETLVDFLTTHDLLPETLPGADLFIGTPAESDIATAHGVANELRDAGLNVFVNVSEKSLGDQVKEAVRRGIPYFMAVGAEEKSSGKMKLKTLAASTEEELSLSDIARRIRPEAG
ncbi:MAG TPA: histidine--tRNA ligase [Candidatus Paceibacterota bacterium]|nr:histidine--tRNA ligase [Candidatus Paceibacterota bacterium]